MDEMNKVNRRILHMDSDIPSIFFPIGKIKDGGTCEFATAKCMRICPSGGITNIHEQYTYNFFKSKTADIIITKLKEDFDYLSERPYNARMIQWFCWGDCPSFMTKKVLVVILGIRDLGIPQYGFTRNKKLWELIPNEDRLHIGLTVDNLESALLLSEVKNKMIAHPDFEHGYAEMIFKGKIRSRCSGWWCITELETRNSDCGSCLSHGEGCYYRKDENKVK